MAPSDQSGLSSKVFHFDVKYHMARYLLIANWCSLPVRQDLEGNFHVLHFLGYLIRPEGSSGLLVYFKGLSHGLWQFNPKLVGLFKVSYIFSPDEQKYPVTLPQDVWNPPVERWFVVYPNHHCIFSNKDRMGFFKVCQSLP